MYLRDLIHQEIQIETQIINYICRNIFKSGEEIKTKRTSNSI